MTKGRRWLRKRWFFLASVMSFMLGALALYYSQQAYPQIFLVQIQVPSRSKASTHLLLFLGILWHAEARDLVSRPGLKARE